MKNPAVAEGHRLVLLLQDALVREARLWKVPVFKGGCIQGTDISLYEQQEVIQWLGEMSRLFQFCPETFALGACVLTRLVSTVKAQPKYLKCIAFTSLILAAKINEEDEVMGSVKDLVAQSECNFSTAEILRMERIILDKLNWDLYTATPVDFIHIFHAMLVSGHPHLIPSIGLGSGRGRSGSDPGSGSVSPSRRGPPGRQKRPSGFQVALWTRQVQHCMACHQLWQFKGSTLALAIITLELEALTPDWFSIFTELLKKAQVESSEFIHCKEMVDQHLNNLEFSLPPNAVYILNGARLQEDEAARHRPPGLHLQRGRGGGRGGYGGQGDLEYCDGFGCLYNEGMVAPGAVERDGGERPRNAQHENISPCPPLHPPMV